MPKEIAAGGGLLPLDAGQATPEGSPGRPYCALRLENSCRPRHAALIQIGHDGRLDA